MFRVGLFFIIVLFGEVMMMVGWRWKEVVRISDEVGEDVVVVLGGLVNSYMYYIIMEEEYGI